MKRFRLHALLLAAVGILTYIGVQAAEMSYAQRVLPKQVQGVDYRSTMKAVPANATFEEQSVSLLSKPAKDFTFDDIESWAGEGANRAALVIQWNADGETSALVFGFRWDGQATGADMLKAVVRANPRLYALMQYTNVSSPTDPNGGYTINGIGWDKDDDGDIRLIDTGHDNAVYTSPDGFFEHPRGYVPGQGGSSDYDYDNWKAGDADDYWDAGWYQSYWSYWVGSSATSLGYSGVGASGRVLSDGAWDAWNFSRNFGSYSLKEFEAAPQPIPAGAQTEFMYEGIRYTLKSYANSTVEAASPASENEKYSGVVTIPSTFTVNDTTYTVVGVGKAAFQSSEVTEVVLPSTVTSIGASAFLDSDKLTKINITDNITSIGESAFADCPLTEIHIPSGLKEIPAYAFMGTAITSLVIPENITAIGSCAFATCSALESVEIPATVKTIEEGAFLECSALKSVTSFNRFPFDIDETVFDGAYETATLRVPGGSEELYGKAAGWKNFAKVESFATDVAVGDKFVASGVTYKVTDSGDEAEIVVSYCHFDGKPSATLIKNANLEGYTGDLVIPATVNFQNKAYKVTALADSCFFGAKNLTSVVLPEGLTAIPKHAFNMNLAYKETSSLKSITIPSTVITIGQYAFNYCDSVKSFVLPEALTTIEANAFSQCQSLESIEIPAGVTTLPTYLFNYCLGLKNVVMKGAVTKMGTNVFYMCQSLESIELPESLTEIPGYAFGSCTSLKEVKMPAGVTSIGGSAFNGCSSLETIDLTNIKTISSQAFQGCTKLNVELPSGLTTLGMAAFENCKALKSVVIPASVTRLDTRTFSGCSSLEEVTFANRVTSIQSAFFKDCTSLRNIVFAGNGQTAATAAEADDETAPVVVLPEGITSIATNAFVNCKALNLSPKLPSTLTSIGDYAFDGMTQLTAIELPDNLTTIGTYMFRNTSLKELVFPAKIATTKNYMVNGVPAGLKIYYTNATPFTCTANALKLTSNTYADVILPSGTSAAFYAKSSYWKTAGAREPKLDVTFEAGKATPGNNDDAEITSELSVDYAEAIPERFAAMNEKQLSAATVKLVYSEVVEADEPEALADDAEANEVEATLSSGKLSATLTGLKPGTKYTYHWVYTLGTTEVASEPDVFVTDGTSAIAGIAADGSGISYADGILTLPGCAGAVAKVISMNGAVCATFECQAEASVFDLNVAPGVYIVSVSGNGAQQAAKIVIR